MNPRTLKTSEASIENTYFERLQHFKTEDTLLVNLTFDYDGLELDYTSGRVAAWTNLSYLKSGKLSSTTRRSDFAVFSLAVLSSDGDDPFAQIEDSL